MISWAHISKCGNYRYELTRRWDDDLPMLGWIMLNPSTADASIDDPTIRRCIGFAKSWGFGSIMVTNLFALRATNPRELLSHPDPVGPENDNWLELQPQVTVAAWGAHKMAIERVDSVRHLNLMCLGTTKSGAPKHPLYVPSSTTLEPWKKSAA